MAITQLDQYQALCRRTANTNPHADTPERRILNFALGLNGEAAEVAELLTALDPRLAQLASDLQASAGRVAEYVKKTIFHRHPEWDQTKAKLAKELGDNLWYLAMAADVIGQPLSQIATANIEKLRQRYPDGFTTQAAKERRDEK